MLPVLCSQWLDNCLVLRAEHGIEGGVLAPVMGGMDHEQRRRSAEECIKRDVDGGSVLSGCNNMLASCDVVSHCCIQA